MLEHAPTPGFHAWWDALSHSEQASLNKYMARRAYLAGMRAVPARPVKEPAPTLKTFRFQAGKWRVVVKAASLKAAKIAAIQKLDQRAKKCLATTPSGGWQLMLTSK
jgi:hypothetical protein